MPRSINLINKPKELALSKASLNSIDAANALV